MRHRYQKERNKEKRLKRNNEMKKLKVASGQTDRQTDKQYRGEEVWRAKTRQGPNTKNILLILSL